MRLQNLFLGMFLWGAAIHPVCSAASPVLQAKLHPAVYKSSSGPVRRVAVTVGYDGQATEAELALGRQVRRVRLEEGENISYSIFQTQAQTVRCRCLYVPDRCLGLRMK